MVARSGRTYSAGSVVELSKAEHLPFLPPRRPLHCQGGWICAAGAPGFGGRIAFLHPPFHLGIPLAFHFADDMRDNRAFT